MAVAVAATRYQPTEPKEAPIIFGVSSLWVLVAAPNAHFAYSALTTFSGLAPVRERANLSKTLPGTCRCKGGKSSSRWGYKGSSQPPFSEVAGLHPHLHAQATPEEARQYNSSGITFDEADHGEPPHWLY